ncbi:MAG TPA: hypothetical protein VJ913_11690 [Actinomycetota bacterium]|nr:hypothetical protein [Actinomycetota bacterium]
MSSARRTTRSVLALLLVSGVLAGCTISTGRTSEVSCPVEDRELLLLAAQAVPSATLIPCVTAFPAGWWFGGSDVRSGNALFWLESDRAGFHAVEISLTASCRTIGAIDMTNSTQEVGVQELVRVYDLHPFTADRYFLFTGGCVTYRYRFDADAAATLALEVDQAVTFGLRTALVERIEDEFGLTLCGASAPPCLAGG